MWCQTANHAGEAFYKAHGGLQGSRAARTSLQSRMSATVLSSFSKLIACVRMHISSLFIYITTMGSGFSQATTESIFALINFTLKEGTSLLFSTKLIAGN